MAKKKNLPKPANAVDRVKRAMASLEQMEAASKVDPMPPAKPPGRGSPQFVLRYTPEMRDKIARLAKANGRSINAELIALLERAISYGDDVEQLQASMGEIFDRVEKLESLVSDHDAQLNNRDDPSNMD
jgi:hypothetical protein